LTGATLFGLGALKTIITGTKWFISGLEMLLVGGVAASAAYLVGVLLVVLHKPNYQFEEVIYEKSLSSSCRRLRRS